MNNFVRYILHSIFYFHPKLYVCNENIESKIIISTSKIHSCNNNYVEIVRDRSSIIIISRQSDFVVGQTRRRIESTSIKNNTLAGIYNYQKRKHFTAPIIPDAFNHPAETSPVGQTINMENQRRSYTIFLAIIKSIIHRYRESIPYILDWQLNNCGFFLENQKQFFHGTK